MELKSLYRCCVARSLRRQFVNRIAWFRSSLRLHGAPFFFLLFSWRTIPLQRRHSTRLARLTSSWVHSRKLTQTWSTTRQCTNSLEPTWRQQWQREARAMLRPFARCWTSPRLAPTTTRRCRRRRKGVRTTPSCIDRDQLEMQSREVSSTHRMRESARAVAQRLTKAPRCARLHREREVSRHAQLPAALRSRLDHWQTCTVHD